MDQITIHSNDLFRGIETGARGGTTIWWTFRRAGQEAPSTLAIWCRTQRAARENFLGVIPHALSRGL